MFSTPTDLFLRARQVIQDEGLVRFARTALSFVRRQLLLCETWYLSEQTLKERNEAEYLPKVQDFLLKIITSNQEVDELTAEGFDFRPWYRGYRKRLDAGAIALCIFVGRELASILWVALTQQAKDSLGQLPNKVDFSKGEAYAGGTWTSPKYRRMGLTRYNVFKREQLQLENGMMINRGATSQRNIAGWMTAVEVGMNVYAEARYIKILWWKSWKERPLRQSIDLVAGA